MRTLIPKQDWKFWVAALILIGIALVNNVLIKRVSEAVQIIAKKQDRDEQLMVNALYQAVTRWDELQKRNPQLSVPVMPAPTPLFTPTPAP